LHRLVERYFVWIVGPVGTFVVYYTRVFELMLLRRSGVLTKSRAREILDELTVRRFLGKAAVRENPRSLPPPQ